MFVAGVSLLWLNNWAKHPEGEKLCFRTCMDPAPEGVAEQGCSPPHSPEAAGEDACANGLLPPALIPLGSLAYGLVWPIFMALIQNSLIMWKSCAAVSSLNRILDGENSSWRLGRNSFASRSSIFRSVRNQVPAGGGAEPKDDLCALRVHLLLVSKLNQSPTGSSSNCLGALSTLEMMSSMRPLCPYPGK